MEGLITGPFADDLKSRRELCNRKFAMAQSLYPRISEEELASFLSVHVQSVVNALHESFRGNTGALSESLYDFALEAVGKRIFQDGAAMKDCWRDLLIGFGNFLAEDPAAFPRTIADALFNLSLKSREAPDGWARLLLSLKEHAGTGADFLSYGKAAAWRSGMAQYREDSLRLLKGFPAAVRKLILGLPGTMSDGDLGKVLSMIEEDPWFDPLEYSENKGKRDLGLDIVAVVSGFRGFRGHFVSPPLVESVNGELIAYDQGSSYLIMSDTFGTTLSRVNLGNEGFRDTQGEGKIGPDGSVEFRGLSGRFPELADPASFASTTFTMAVTISTSHSLYLIAGRSHAGRDE